MRISDWSSDLCSSDLHDGHRLRAPIRLAAPEPRRQVRVLRFSAANPPRQSPRWTSRTRRILLQAWTKSLEKCVRSEEHTSELQSLMRISYAVFCLKKKI